MCGAAGDHDQAAPGSRTTKLGRLRSEACQGGTGPTRADGASPATFCPQRSGLKVVPGIEPAFSTVAWTLERKTWLLFTRLSFFSDYNTCLLSEIRKKSIEGSRLSFTITPPKIITVNISGTFLPGSFIPRYTQFKIRLELYYIYILNNFLSGKVIS